MKCVPTIWFVIQINQLYLKQNKKTNKTLGNFEFSVFYELFIKMMMVLWCDSLFKSLYLLKILKYLQI